jgi:hypothetical protein
MAQQATDARASMERQSADMRVDLSVRLHMMMEEKWDGERMAIQRARLARELLDKADHDAIPEAVMEFFESLSILDRLGLVHPELDVEHVRIPRIAVVDRLPKLHSGRAEKTA